MAEAWLVTSSPLRWMWCFWWWLSGYKAVLELVETLVPPGWAPSLVETEQGQCQPQLQLWLSDTTWIPCTSESGGIFPSLRASLCVSGVLLGLFVFTWVLGLLAVYGQPFKSPLPQLFESGFAILYATMGGFVFIVFCLNNKVGLVHCITSLLLYQLFIHSHRSVKPAGQSSATKMRIPVFRPRWLALPFW